jgi:hypothetical protein
VSGSWLRPACQFAGEVPVLCVHPLSSVMPPHVRYSVDVEFIPNEEKLSNYNLNCIIKRKTSRLSLNVKVPAASHKHTNSNTLSALVSFIP